MSTRILDPALIVEGRQEARFIKELHRRNKCQDIKVMTLHGTNGKKVPLRVLATKIDALIRSQKQEFAPYIILIDRERRNEKGDQIIKELKDELKAFGYDESRLIIGVANQKLEAWILPFVGENGKFPVEPTSEFEGQSCGEKLGERLKKQGVSYKKMDTGIKLLLAIDPAKLAKVSESFAAFYYEAKDYCKWMNGKKIRYKGK